jgi:phage terminase small subunit
MPRVRPTSRPRTTLTVKQAKFLDEYLKEPNARTAAEKAGYNAKSPKSAANIGFQMLNHPLIQKELNARREMLMETCGM